MSPETVKELLPIAVDVVVLVVVPFVGWAVRKWLLDKASAERQQQIVAASDLIYRTVEAIARRTPGEIDDKLAVAMGQLSAALGRKLTPQESELAKAAFAAQAHTDKERLGSLSLASMPCGHTNVR